MLLTSGSKDLRVEGAVAKPSAASIFERLLLRAHRRRGFVQRSISTSQGFIKTVMGQGGASEHSMVMVHGFASSGVQMGPFAWSLQPHVRRIEILDLLGHGFSEVPEIGLHRDNVNDSTFEALDAIPSPFVLVGNSMGGYFALKYALKKPHRVSRLILCSPGGAPLTEQELETVKQNFRVQTHRQGLEFVDRLFGKPHRLRHLYAAGVRLRLQKPYLLRLLNSITMDDFLTEMELAELKVPTCLVWGKEDEVLPSSGLDFFRKLPTLSTVVEPQGVGHSPHLEIPQKLAESVLAFIRMPIESEEGSSRLIA